jgi:hypothetical protein
LATLGALSVSLTSNIAAIETRIAPLEPEREAATGEYCRVGCCGRGSVEPLRTHGPVNDLGTAQRDVARRVRPLWGAVVAEQTRLVADFTALNRSQTK